jgi:transcriptional regulator with XRE-family HTH domain
MLTTIMIGNKIAEARKKINISQAQLAERLFISPQAVGKWERGESMPDIVTFNRLAEILGVDLNYFSENFRSQATKSFNDMTVTAESELTEQGDLNSPGAMGKDPGGHLKKKPVWDMSRGNWIGADFSGLKNLNDKFSSSNMLRCLFIGSDLSGLLLKGNNVDSCDFSGSRLNGSNIQRSNLLNNLFRDCSLKEAEFTESHVMGSDFSGTDFTGATFKSGGFQNNTVTKSIWNSTNFNSMYIAGIVFDSTVEDCSFENCAFKKVTFRNATLINTFFKNKNLKEIKFIDCQADRMTYEFLKNGKADLAGITLHPQI